MLADPVAVDRAYRLALDVDGANPVLTLYAQAPTPRAAIALVDAARALLQRHVSAQESSYPLGPEQTVVLRPLGPTVGGLVDPDARRQLMAAAFLLVLVLGGGPLYTYRRRSDPRSAASAHGARAWEWRVDRQLPREGVQRSPPAANGHTRRACCRGRWRASWRCCSSSPSTRSPCRSGCRSRTRWIARC